MFTQLESWDYIVAENVFSLLYIADWFVRKLSGNRGRVQQRTSPFLPFRFSFPLFISSGIALRGGGVAAYIVSNSLRDDVVSSSYLDSLGITSKHSRFYVVQQWTHACLGY